MSQGDFPGVELGGGPCEERAPALPGGHFDRYFPASGKSAHISGPATELKPGGTRQSAHELPVPIRFIPTETGDQREARQPPESAREGQDARLSQAHADKRRAGGPPGEEV